MIDFLHIGDYKTGTTWLQKYFYSIHPDISYLGGPFNNQLLEKYLHELIDSRDLDFDSKNLRKKIEKQVGLIIPGKKTGISREVFSATNFVTGENARRNAERLYSIFGDVKVVFIIREQINMLTSIYSQYVKMGGTLPIKSFVFDPIVSNGLLERLKWHKQITMYREIFGADNVHIGLYEEFRDNKEKFLYSLSEFLEIGNVLLKNEINSRANKALSSFSCEIARIGNKAFRSHLNNAKNNGLLNKLLLKIASSKTITSIDEDTAKRVIPNYGELDYIERIYYGLNWTAISKLRRFAESISYGRNIQLPTSIIDGISGEFKSSNRILLKDYGLPVDCYGYEI
jgi:hypothetical protein